MKWFKRLWYILTLDYKLIKDYEGHEYSGLFCLGTYISWRTNRNEAVLDGEFTADELMVIAIYMKENKR